MCCDCKILKAWTTVASPYNGVINVMGAGLRQSAHVVSKSVRFIETTMMPGTCERWRHGADGSGILHFGFEWVPKFTLRVDLRPTIRTMTDHDSHSAERQSTSTCRASLMALVVEWGRFETCRGLNKKTKSHHAVCFSEHTMVIPQFYCIF